MTNPTLNTSSTNPDHYSQPMQELEETPKKVIIPQVVELYGRRYIVLEKDKLATLPSNLLRTTSLVDPSSKEEKKREFKYIREDIYLKNLHTFLSKDDTCIIELDPRTGEETTNSSKQRKNIKKEYEELLAKKEENNTKLKEDLGFDPRDTASIKKYVDERRNDLRDANGHYWMPILKRSKESGFIFIEKGRVNNPKAYHYIVLSDASSGLPVENTAEFYRAINSFCAAYDSMDEGWEKEIDKIAALLAKKQGQEGDETIVEDLKKKLRQRPHQIVLDYKNKNIRIFSNPDGQINMSSYKYGTVIKLPSKVTKEIEMIHNENLSKDKRTNDGPHPFKNGPKDGANPFADLLNNMPKSKKTNNTNQNNNSVDEDSDNTQSNVNTQNENVGPQITEVNDPPNNNSNRKVEIENDS